MRISDWSSDVCSSDLPVTAIGRVDEQLRVGTLKLNSQGLELLSLKERGSASQEKRSANFFITKAQLKALHAALDRYEGHKSGKRPRRVNLIETVTSRSEERRVGKECVRKCLYRCSP